MFINSLSKAYKMMQEKIFNWDDIKELENLKILLSESSNAELKKKISEYILEQIAYMDEYNDRIHCDFSFVETLDDLHEKLSFYIDKINLFKTLYLSCNVKDDILTNFLNKTINSIIKYANECFLSMYAEFTGGHIDSSVLKDDKYFIKLKYPFTLKELSAYRKKISKIYHPDNGGNVEDMSKINEIFNVLKTLAI